MVVEGNDSMEVDAVAVPDSSIFVFDISVKTEIKIQRNNFFIIKIQSNYYCLFMVSWCCDVFSLEALE